MPVRRASIALPARCSLELSQKRSSAAPGSAIVAAQQRLLDEVGEHAEAEHADRVVDRAILRPLPKKGRLARRTTIAASPTSRPIACDVSAAHLRLAQFFHQLGEDAWAGWNVDALHGRACFRARVLALVRTVIACLHSHWIR